MEHKKQNQPQKSQEEKMKDFMKRPFNREEFESKGKIDSKRTFAILHGTNSLEKKFGSSHFM